MKKAIEINYYFSLTKKKFYLTIMCNFLIKDDHNKNQNIYILKIFN